MRESQIRLQEILRVIQRRWKLITFPAILVTIFCTIGAFVLPRQYESSTTILVKPDQTLNPMSSYDVTMALEEQLSNFDQIMHSRTLLLRLADSLGLGADEQMPERKMNVVESIDSKISTTRLGSNSFRVAYIDTDPAKAQRAAQILANLYIQTKLTAENKQNQLTVEFYENKVEEYRKAFETSVQSLVLKMKKEVDEQPVETRSLYLQLDELQRSLNTVADRIQLHKDGFVILNTLPEQVQSSPELLKSEAGVQLLLALQREELPLSSDLRLLLSRYDEISARYTLNHPDAERVRTQIVDLLSRMRRATAASISRLITEQKGLEKNRERVIEELKRMSARSRTDEDVESGYEVNRRLYDEMQLKLEQARLTQAVGSRGANQFLIIDPAFVPVRPTKPNRPLIVFAGLGFGFLLGILSVVMAEFLDTVVRSPRDIEVYRKPVIALLPDASRSIDA